MHEWSLVTDDGTACDRQSVKCELRLCLVGLVGSMPG